MTIQYTPTPWATQGRVKITRHVDGFQINPKMFVAIARDVTEPGNPPFAYAENQQIAEAIVRACNAHEELLKWAKAVFNNYDGQGFVDSNHNSHPLFHLGAAIKKAEANV